MSQHPANLTAAGIAPGDKIDKFEVVEQIGAGGMSVVWKGYDRLLDRFVAIKQLGGDAGLVDDDEFRERFRQEAKIQKRLAAGSKNLVRVIDFIEEQRGLFIVMEYVDGPSLEALLSQSEEPMDQRQALGIIGATALALDSMHSQGVMHRDLKPSNILLPQVGGLKVCDFGLSMLMADQEAPSAGSVRYMAPELFRNEPVDHKADIYAMGMIAYEMLAGRTRFGEAFKVVLRDQRNQALRWMKWHTNQRVTAPPLSHVNPDVPETLSDLVARMMEKDPGQRVPSAKDLLAAIRRHFAGGAAVNEPDIPKGDAAQPTALAAASSEKTAKLPKKSKLPYILAAVLSLQVCVGLGVWAYINKSKQDEQQKQIYDKAEALFAQAQVKVNEANDLFDQSAQKFDELKRSKADGLFAGAIEDFKALGAEWPDHKKFGETGKTISLYCAGMRAFIAHEYVPAVRLFEEAADRGMNSLHDHDGRIAQVNARADIALSFTEVEDALGMLRPKYEAWYQRAVQLVAQIGEKDKSREAMGDEAWEEWSTSFQEEVNALRSELDREAGLAARDLLDSATRGLLELVEIADQGRDEDGAPVADATTATLDKARQVIDEMHAQPNFRAARHELRLVTDAAASSFLEDEQRYADELGTIIEDKELRSTIDRIIAKANELVEMGQRDVAINGLRAAVEKHPAREIRELLSKLELGAEHDRALAAGQQAEAEGNLTAAVASYEAVLKIKPDAELEDRVKRIKSRAAYMQGLTLEQNGNVDAAATAYRRALELYENEQAREGLARIQNLDKRTSLVRAGDDAFNAGNFITALNQYRKAQQINTTPDVAEKIATATINAELQKAQQALRDGRLADVASALAAVDELDPGNQTAAALRQHVGRVKTYVAHRDKGDEFRQSSDFGRAIREYRLARDVFDPPPPEIVARINDTEYASLMAGARRDMKNLNYKAAYALLRTAARVKQTKEVTQLLEEVASKINAKKPAGAG